MGRGFVRTVVLASGIVGGICLLLYLFVFDTWVLPANDPLFVSSVLPTLHPEDRILVRRGGGDLRVGQLARCASPEPGLDYVIGRVAGTSGETLEIRDERIYANGKPIPTRHACPAVTVAHPVTGQQVSLACRVESTGSSDFSYLVATDYPEGTRVAAVEPGKLFLLSDNRHIHKDSRDFGQVDASTCEHVVFRLWGESFIEASRRFTVLY